MWVIHLAHDGRERINNNYYNNNNFCHHSHRLITDAAIIHDPTRQIIKYSIFIVNSAAKSVLVRLLQRRKWYTTCR